MQQESGHQGLFACSCGFMIDEAHPSLGASPDGSHIIKGSHFSSQSTEWGKQQESVAFKKVWKCNKNLDIKDYLLVHVVS